MCCLGGLCVQGRGGDVRVVGGDSVTRSGVCYDRCGYQD